MELPDIDEDFQTEKVDDIIGLLREEYGDDNVLQCATFKTESLKSAILSCGRGLGFNSDEMRNLSSLVPAHRGQTYTLNECLNGDEEKGLEPVDGFRDKFNPYPGLFDAVKKIEGLPSNNSRHASALYVFNDGYLAQNSLINTPNGTKTTAFSMHDSDEMGALKMDLLVTDAQSKIAKCLELLLNDKKIQWQGSLRETYNKYLHPDVLEFDNPKIWELASSGTIPQLFQFDTQVGAVCIQKAKPKNVMQLAEVNSIMRLQVEGSEQPIDRYVRFSTNIQEWYKEMHEAGLTEHEINILEKYLLKSNGVSGSQETLMQILMDPEVCSFTLGEANGARKAIAKKISKKIIQLKKDFYEKGAHTRKEFLDYVWKTCIEPQLGYSFSLNHTLPYSVIAVQELQLNVKYSPLYWACACLCINAGSTADSLESYDDEEGDEEEDNFEEVSEGEQKARTAASNYKKIGKAIGDIQMSHIKIAPPDINRASIDFIPDTEHNAIIYGFLGVKDVNEDLISRIMANRPFTSSIDFYNRVQPTNVQMISLIKAGAFDEVDKKSRYAIMENYLRTKAMESITLKASLTAANIKKAVALKVLPTNLHNHTRLYNFVQWIDAHQYDKPNKRYVFDDVDVIAYFNQAIRHKFSAEKGDYYEMGGKIIVQKKAMTKVYKELIQPLRDWLNSKEGCQAFYEGELNAVISEQKDKYCQGNDTAWEFDALTCYMREHELMHINFDRYNIVDFNSLPEQLISTGKRKNAKTGREYNTYNLVRIAGTVVGTDNNKHIVTVLTPTGVVDIKFYKENYIHYNQNISEIVREEGKKDQKVTIEKSWFARGNKLLITGVRRENMFLPKADWEGGYPAVALITGIHYDLDLKKNRKKAR